MCDLGLNPEDFNPGIMYILKKKYDCESRTRYHSHDFISVIYILSGACTYKIDDNFYPVKKGDIVIVNPGVFHGKMLSTDEEIIEFQVGFNNINIKDMPNGCIIDAGVPPVINLSKYEEEFFKCCSEILTEQERHEPGWDLTLKALVMKLIVILLKGTCTNDTLSENGILNFEYYDRTNIVNSIVAFINDNYMKAISLDKISKNMYLSPVYISKIFKEETGDSPINYLIKVRLSKAKEILEQGLMSVKAAAKSVGYDDAYYFSKLFKKYYGCPPSKYKIQAHI